MRRARSFTQLPIAVGFGISLPGHVSVLGGLADAAVVGSALVSEIEKAASPDGSSCSVLALRERVRAAKGSRAPAAFSPRGYAMKSSDWRRRIDEIDKKLVELLNERSQCALEIGRIKQESNIPLYQPDRENEVLANAESNNKGPLSDAAIRRLFERIIDEARSAERWPCTASNLPTRSPNDCTSAHDRFYRCCEPNSRD